MRQSSLRDRTGLGRRLAVCAVVAWLAVEVISTIATSQPGGGQYELHALHRSSSEFARGDWFIEETSSYHPLQSWFRSEAETRHRLMEVTFGFSAVTQLSVVAAILVLIRGLGAPFIMVAPAFFLLNYGIQDTWGSQSLSGPWHGLAVVSLSLLVTGRRRAGLVVAVVALYGHFSVGAWLIAVAMLLVLHDLAQGEIDRRDALRLVTLALAPALPLILWAGSSFTTDVPPETYDLLFHIRAPHHYSPLFFSDVEHIKALYVALVALGAEWALRPLRRRIRTLIIALIGIQLLGFVFLEIVPWPLYVRLFPYRVAPWLTFVAIALVVALVASPSNRGYQRALSLIAAFGIFAIDRPGLFDRFLSSTLTTAFILLLGVIAIAGAVSVRSMRIDRSSTSFPSRSEAMISLLLVSFFLNGYLLARDMPDVSPLAQSFAPYEPDARFTDVFAVGDLLLVDPQYSSMRQQSGRAIVVDFANFPMQGEKMLEWQYRLETVVGQELPQRRARGDSLERQLGDLFDQRPLDDLIDVARSFEADALLVTSDSRIADEIRQRQQPYVLIDDEWIAIMMRDVP